MIKQLELDFDELSVLCRYRHAAVKGNKDVMRCAILEEEGTYNDSCDEWYCPRLKEVKRNG